MMRSKPGALDRLQAAASAVSDPVKPSLPQRVIQFSCSLSALLVLASAAVAATPEPCTLTLSNNPALVEAECFSLQVPENRQAPDGRQISLEVAILKARSAQPATDPVFFFAGGPGQSAIDVLIVQARMFTALSKKRDIVFIDQRGTGRSNPLNCEFEDPSQLNVPDEELKRMVAECVEQLDGDPRYYATRHAIEDVEAVRQALGYDKINVMGGSYGTRVAQEYLRRYPEQTRSIVIDAIVYPEDILGTEHAMNLTAALTSTVERCTADANCSRSFPELNASLQAYLETDVTAVREVEFRDPRTGEWVTRNTNREELDVAIRMYAYEPSTIALLPLMITRAAGGEWRELVAGAQLIADQLGGMMATGMHNAVMCSEDVPFFPEADARSGDTAIAGNAILGRLTHLVGLMCEVWPIEAPDPGVHRPLDSDVPALLLSGEMDPVTPPRYGDKALAQFSNGTHLVGRGLGHIISGNPCFRDVVAAFVATLEVPEKAGTCTSIDWSSAFFTDLSGATP